jgi:hypothetical protein
LELEKSQQKDLMKFVEGELKSTLEAKGSHEKPYRLNGRQIRNGIRAALALARQAKVPLSKEHILQVIDLGKDLDQDQRALLLG